MLDRTLAAGISSQQLRGGRGGLPAHGDAQGPSTQRGSPGAGEVSNSLASLHESLMKRGGLGKCAVKDAHNPAAQEH